MVVIEPTRDEGDCADAELGQRLLRRAASRLVAGGRLLVELPMAASIAAALEQFDPRAVDSNWAGFRLHARDDTHEYEAVVFGRDIPALVARNMPLPGVEVSLQPWRAVREQTH